METKAHGKPYARLLGMTILHFMAMYGLMYAMVATAADIFPNNNQLYMAALMTSPMLLIELWLMGGMYPRKAVNAVLILAGLVLLGGSFLLIRQQTLIDDRQFLKSMIPHHSGAILMCGEAPIRDPEVRALCTGIIESQAREIRIMKAKLMAMDAGAG